jgi:ubiquinone/menaquinone biosynthesis C-methylase UbiE
MASSPQYIAGRSWEAEDDRLSALERALDPTTRRHLERLGIARGARCLEVGAGGGSIAAWMASVVGSHGYVVVTDLDTRVLEDRFRKHANVVVRNEDIVQGVSPCAPDASFDFAHARLVLGHVADRERAIMNIARVVRPGGWILIEDADFLWVAVGEQPLYPDARAAACFNVAQAIVAHMAQRGYDVHWGRRIAGALRAVGLEHVGGEASMLVGDRALTEAMRMTIERFGSELVSAGKLDGVALRACLDALNSPDTLYTGSPTFSVWGSVPG